MKVIVERNPLEGAPMEPFWIASVRFACRAVVCAVLIVTLVIAIARIPTS